MRHKKALTVTLCLLAMALFLVLRVKMNFGVKPNVGVIPRLSAMILYKGWPDDEITKAIAADKRLLSEHFYDSLVVAQRTPLLSALEKERYGLVVSFLKQGVPVRDTVEILRTEGLHRQMEALREIVERERVKGIDCDAVCFGKQPAGSSS